MVSNPRTQAAFHVFSATRPLSPAALAEWAAEVRAWAALAEEEDFGLEEREWALFRNGAAAPAAGDIQP